jgi:hypothetical protein
VGVYFVHGLNFFLSLCLFTVHSYNGDGRVLEGVISGSIHVAPMPRRILPSSHPVPKFKSLREAFSTVQARVPLTSVKPCVSQTDGHVSGLWVCFN